jgi:hypothetical protein
MLKLQNYTNINNSQIQYILLDDEKNPAKPNIISSSLSAISIKNY